MSFRHYNTLDDDEKLLRIFTMSDVCVCKQRQRQNHPYQLFVITHTLLHRDTDEGQERFFQIFSMYNQMRMNNRWKFIIIFPFWMCICMFSSSATLITWYTDLDIIRIINVVYACWRQNYIFLSIILSFLLSFLFYFLSINKTPEKNSHFLFLLCQLCPFSPHTTKETKNIWKFYLFLLNNIEKKRKFFIYCTII